MKKLMAGAAAMAIVALAAPTSAAPKAKPVVVFEDKAGDAGNQDSGIPGFDQAGFDLIKGTIVKSGANLDFTAEHTAMPPTGSGPEVARLLWHISVNGEQYRFTIKSVDIGKPDIIAMSGTERVGQVYTEGVFRLEQCTETPAAITLINCNTLEYLEGSWDPAAKTVTVSLPLATVKAKTGSIIAGGTSGAAGSGCQICWVSHLAERSLTASTIIDSAAMGVTYKVPK